MLVRRAAAVGWLALVWCTGCAASVDLPRPDGEEFAPGMYSFDGQRAATRDSTLRPWSPNYFYPALDEVEPRVAGTRPIELPTEVPRHATSRGPGTAAAWLWYGLYKQTLSRVDGNTCRFSPSCSTFGLRAVREHGPLGFAMAFGRLHRNHSDEVHYPSSRPPFLDDPVANYGFWLRAPRLDDFGSYANPAFAWYQHLRAVRQLRAPVPAMTPGSVSD